MSEKKQYYFMVSVPSGDGNTEHRMLPGQQLQGKPVDTEALVVLRKYQQHPAGQVWATDTLLYKSAGYYVSGPQFLQVGDEQGEPLVGQDSAQQEAISQWKTYTELQNQ